MDRIDWHNIQRLNPARSYTCGYCDIRVAAGDGYKAEGRYATDTFVGICPHCHKPTFFQGDTQVPGTAYGSPVEHLPADVEGLYTEARNCMRVNAFTASVFACRKMLMNVCVVHGAKEGLRFEEYVKFLDDEGYIPVNAKPWVDHIRKKGNEANHQIPAISRQDAEELLTFVEMLLKMMFDYPARAPGGRP